MVFYKFLGEGHSVHFICCGEVSPIISKFAAKN